MAETVNIFTPLGIRFWDSVLDRQVSDNLIVKAYPGSAPGAVVDAFRTASGVYAFQGLPGMHEIERYEGDDFLLPTPAKPFIIEVKDKLKRFLPMVFKVKLPLSYTGVYQGKEFAPDSGSPPSMEDLPGIFLVSAPTRTPLTGLAVIHATLVEKNANKPAAFAVMEVKVEGEETRYGIADHRGCITIMFPYPTFKVPLSSSPPANIIQQEWELIIRVYYGPGELKYPDNMNIPYLEEIAKQGQGGIWTDLSKLNSDEQSTEVLTFGKELILKTGNALKSVLLIDAAKSSP